MEQANWAILPIAAFFPLILGYIWYHPTILGTKLSQLTGDPLPEKRPIGKIILIYLFSVILAYILALMSVHQTAIFQLFFMDPELADINSKYHVFINEFMAEYGDRHRSFGHGMIHGAEAGLFFGLSFFGITTLMQNKPLKLVWIHLVFWILCCSLMAGLICEFF